MSGDVLAIERFMTNCPVTIAPSESVAAASRVMREHDIRHLPVLDGRRLVGIVTDRDLHLVQSLIDVDPGKITVGDAMEQKPFCVGPEAPLAGVVGRMAADKIGSAVVMRDEEVVGIFTTIDALHALRDLLGGRARG